ncbi:MAG: xanthine dehydrogenase family protein subunit M [Proteobacteria bacterium]|nr:xanthine dehydrogenase family protein subunit M [Pseudomonadota bacterium]MBU1452684.1 xanthine dehydrogenase family protein subunit M [Pseudomonadota bacterium]MBU2467207.1 xanthine dehydrogenase family protein subunit M [Pseudomonadota bacterium]MBU2518971.1 xanthine dehydrogenase family protein subunit M [Pseudomonadota bacterium]
MKPAAFDYIAPKTVEEVISLLTTHEDEAKILAGGQSLMPIMNFRLGRPGLLIDINGLDELDYIKQQDDHLLIGGLTRERTVERSPLVRDLCPLLSQAISFVGHTAIRNRGTVGGSLVHADPSGEIPTAFCALDGRVKAVGPDGERWIDPGEFFLTFLTTSLEPTELLVEVKVPVLPQGTGWSFMELSRRVGDFAIIGVATLLFMNGDGTCREARIALGGVAPTPFRAEEAEEVLAGQAIGEELISRAGELAGEAADAEDDYHASAEYRQEMAKIMVSRSLRQALARTGKGN